MKKRIVCIDDDVSILDIVKATLEATGQFEVFPYRLPNEAVNRVDTIKPDLILLDMVMAVMSGVSTIKVLRMSERRRAYPVAFLTAKSSDEDMALQKELGACGTISKPIDVRTFPAQVMALCNLGEGETLQADEQKMLGKMLALREKYLTQINERRSALVSFRELCEKGMVSDAQCDAIYNQAHSLAGSGATYGFPGISETARALTDALQNGQRNADILLKMVNALIVECDKARASVTG